MTISVNTMRAIDHWVGVPLCAIASPVVALIDSIKNIFNRGPQTPKRLLFIELSEMGSAILVDPAMRNAQARGAELFFLIFKSNRASLTLLNTVKPENIFTIDSSSLSGLIKDTLRFLWIARWKRIDTVIDLELFSRFTALLTGLCGARRRVGYHIFHGEGLWRGFMLTRKVHYNPHIHITKNFLSLIHAAFAQEIEVPFSKIHIADSEVKLEQAVIHPEALEKVRARIEKKAKEAQAKKEAATRKRAAAKKYKPSPIGDDHDTLRGWLGPNGDFYTLGGEIHVYFAPSLAAALYDDFDPSEDEAVRFLRDKGWVRLDSRGDVVDDLNWRGDLTPAKLAQQQWGKERIEAGDPEFTKFLILKPKASNHH